MTSPQLEPDPGRLDLPCLAARLRQDELLERLVLVRTETGASVVPSSALSNSQVQRQGGGAGAGVLRRAWWPGAWSAVLLVL